MKRFLKILKFKLHVLTTSCQNWVKDTQFVHHVQPAVKIPKSGHILTFVQVFSNIYPNCDVVIPIYLKVDTDLVLIFLSQIIFDMSVWFHFEIALVLLSPFAQEMQIKPFLTQF